MIAVKILLDYVKRLTIAYKWLTVIQDVRIRMDHTGIS